MQDVYPDAYTIDLLEERRYQELLANPATFAEEISSIEKSRWIVVDEIQRLPNLLNEVHRLHEKEKRKFALCGSSARKLKRAGINLLAGRAVQRFLFPFLPFELGNDFSLDLALRYGTIPIIWQASNRQEVLEAYVQMYLREEIQAEAAVKNLPAFARFLPVSALFHGQTLNIASLARDAEAHRTTVTGYLEILEDTLLAFKLDAFRANLRVREKRHPKLYFIDSGIVRTLKKNRGPIIQEEKDSLFEGWVANTLRSYNSYQQIFDDWSYWSPAESKTEVDFLLRQGDQFIAIEAKSSDKISNEDLKGLRAISDLKNLTRRILVYTGKSKRITEDGIEILPINDFLEELRKGF